MAKTILIDDGSATPSNGEQDPSEFHRRSLVLHLGVGVVFGAVLFVFCWCVSPTEAKLPVSLGVLGIFLTMFLTFRYLGQMVQKRRRDSFDLAVRRWNKEGQSLVADQQNILGLVAERLPWLVRTPQETGLIDVVRLLVAVKLGAIAGLMHGEDESHGFGSLIVGLPKLSQDFFTTVEILKNFAVSTQTNVNTIQAAIVDVMAFAQFQDITRQQIEQV